MSIIVEPALHRAPHAQLATLLAALLLSACGGGAQREAIQTALEAQKGESERLRTDIRLALGKLDALAQSVDDLNARMASQAPSVNDDTPTADGRHTDFGEPAYVPPEMLAPGDVVRVSDTRVRVKREMIGRILEDARWARGIRIVPSVKHGKTDGLRVFAIRDNSLWSRVGLQNGDTVHRINDMVMGDPESALEVYAKVRKAPTLKIEMTRKGKPLTLTIVFSRVAPRAKTQSATAAGQRPVSRRTRHETAHAETEQETRRGDAPERKWGAGGFVAVLQVHPKHAAHRADRQK